MRSTIATRIKSSRDPYNYLTRIIYDALSKRLTSETFNLPLILLQRACSYSSQKTDNVIILTCIYPNEELRKFNLQAK